MADHNNTKGDSGHGDGHGGDHGDHGGGDHGEKHGKAGGGSGAARVLRSPVTWAVVGVGALLAVVLASGVQMPTADTGPSSSTVSDSGDVADGSSTSSRSTTERRIGARACVSLIKRARAEHGRDWERVLSRKVHADCDRAIQEARRADYGTSQQAEAPRWRAPDGRDVEVRRLDVAHADLDLSTSDGARRFLDRLERAAVQVCGGRPDIRDLEANRSFKACVERSMDGAVAQLRAPRVTALYRQG